MKKSIRILILAMGVLILVSNIDTSKFVNANDKFFDDVPPIKIEMQNKNISSFYSINPDYLKDFYESLIIKNNNTRINNITLFQKGNISISYVTPCGIPESVNGFLLAGNISEIMEGGYKNLKIEGNQTEFYRNDSPGRNGIDFASIPTLNAGTYTLVFTIDCDESIYYYVEKAVII